MKESSALHYVGNNPDVVLSMTMWHTLELKILTMGLGLIGLAVVGYQYAYQRTFWEYAVERGVPVTPEGSNFTHLGLDSIHSDDPLNDGLFWFANFQFGFGSAVTSFLLSAVIFLHYVNFKLLRCDRVLYLILTGLVPATLLSFLSGYYLWVTPEEETADAIGLFVILLFICGLIPAFVTPYVYGPLLKGVMTRPFFLSVLASVLSVIMAFFVLNIITPAFLQGNTTTRVFIRLIAFPLLIELPAGAARVVARYWMGQNYPMDRILISLVGPIVGSSLMGRFLATNMETIGETVALSLALSVVELLMRSTMLWRDDLYLQCCGRPCGGKQASKKERRAETRAWVMFMLYETIFEDAGILLSLPASLVFRIPPIPGKPPLSALDLVVRVIIQVIIEMFTDIGYAVAYWVMVRCFGVKYSAVTTSEMRLRRRNTKMRFTETRRYLFLPRDPRSINRSMNMSQTTLDQAALVPVGARAETGTTLSDTSGQASRPDLSQAPVVLALAEPSVDSGSMLSAGTGGAAAEGGGSAFTLPPTVDTSAHKGAAGKAPSSTVTPMAGGSRGGSMIDDAVDSGMPRTPLRGSEPVAPFRGSSGGNTGSTTPGAATPVVSGGAASPAPPFLDSKGIPPRHGSMGGVAASPARRVSSMGQEAGRTTSLGETPARTSTADPAPGRHPTPTGPAGSVGSPAGSSTGVRSVGGSSVGSAPLQQRRASSVRTPGGQHVVLPGGVELVSDTASGVTVPVMVSARKVQEEEDVSDLAGVDKAFWSCDPCCLRDTDPVVRHHRSALVAELKNERVVEQEFIWEPLALGLIAYQSSRSRRDLQHGAGAKAQWKHIESEEAPTSPTAAAGVYGAAAGAGGLNASAFVSDEEVPTLAPPPAALHHTPSQLQQGQAEREVREAVVEAQAAGTEPNAGLEGAFDPPLSVMLAMRMELVALRFLRGWETRFRFWSISIALGMLAGTLYALRTMTGNFLCPAGDPGAPDDWIFDYCLDLRT